MRTVRALDECWAAWARLGSELGDTDWQQPTRLTGWSVLDLYAHHSPWPDGFLQMLDRARPGDAELDGPADVLRFFGGPRGKAEQMAEAVARRAHEVASTTTKAEMIDRFERGRQSLARLEDRADHVLDYYGAGLLRVRDAVALGVLESTVHMLDLFAAIDRHELPPADALRITKRILADTAPDVAFIDAATGRTDLSPFPVLR